MSKTLDSETSLEEGYGSTVSVITPPKKPSQALILFHGLSDSSKWWLAFIEAFKTSELISKADETLIIMPNAPVRKVTLIGEEVASWFDLERGENDGYRSNLDDVLETCALAESLVTKVQEKAKIPLSKIILGGFSQGCAISLSAIAILKKKIAGLIAISGFCPIADYVKQNLETANFTTPVIQCHGDDDPVVKYHLAVEAKDLYKGLGFQNWDFKTYSGTGHYFDKIEYDDVLNFIESAFHD